MYYIVFNLKNNAFIHCNASFVLSMHYKHTKHNDFLCYELSFWLGSNLLCPPSSESQTDKFYILRGRAREDRGEEWIKGGRERKVRVRAN